MGDCRLCPRRCGVDRAHTLGVCQQSESLRIARAALHFGEEPCLAPAGGGAGAVFFSGCALGCVYCQNGAISHGREAFGLAVCEERLSEIFLELQAQGAECLDLVTPSHFAPAVCRALRRVRSRLTVPVVWNSSGYESEEQLALTEGLVDVYLPDFKYADSALAARLSAAPDYPEVALRAIARMYRSLGPCRFDETGRMTRGVLVRHLVLPSHTDDSCAVLEALAELFLQRGDVRLSLMRQFTPMPGCPAEELSRPLTSLEYDRVLRCAESLGFLGFTQQRGCATRAEIPVFDGTGVL